MKSGAEQRHFEKNYVSHNLSLNSQLKADQLKYAFKITLIKNWKKNGERIRFTVSKTYRPIESETSL